MAKAKKRKKRKTGTLSSKQRRRLLRPGGPFPEFLRPPYKVNPAKLRKITGSTGWMRADAVRFVKKKGKPVQVFIRRKKAKRRR